MSVPTAALAPEESADRPVDGSLPWVTSEFPGIGGSLKIEHDDFLVEEVPLTRPRGRGAHLWLLLEKRGLTTTQAMQRVARALRVRPSDVRVAGRKDRRAVARQWISVRLEGREADVGAIEGGGLRVLEADRHPSPLRIGQLRGNRFRIRVRGVVSDAVTRAGAIGDVIARRGVPNYFGEQRFGATRDNHLVVLAMLRGRFDEAVDRVVGAPGSRVDAGVGGAGSVDEDQASMPGLARALYVRGDYDGALQALPRSFDVERRVLRALASPAATARRALEAALPRDLQWLLVSAFQGWLFNRCLATRVELGCFDRFLAGDLGIEHASEMIFPVGGAEADVAEAQRRAAASEASPTGPLFGAHMIAPAGRPAELESAVLAALPPEADIARLSDLFPAVHPTGTRRSLRCRVEDLVVEDGSAGASPSPPRRPLETQESGLTPPSSSPETASPPVLAGDLVVSFFLERGNYATTVLREFMKPPTALPTEARGSASDIAPARRSTPFPPEL